MKKLLSLVTLAIIIALTLVLPVSALSSYMGSQPASDFAKIIHDYDVITNDPTDLIVTLFDIKKSDIQMIEAELTAENIAYSQWLQISPGKDTLEETEEYWREYKEEPYLKEEKPYSMTIYYYDFEGDNDSLYDADVKLFVTELNDIYDYYSAEMNLCVSSEALDYIDADMTDLLVTIDTPQKLFDVCGTEVPAKYYDVDAYHADLNMSGFNDLYGSNFWVIGGSAEQGLYNKITKRFVVGSIADTYASDCTYLTSPYCAKICRNFNMQFSDFGTDPTYGYKLNEDISVCELTVNYAAPEGVAEGDYLAYTTDNISIRVVISEMEVTSSPQTGFATVAYAAVAVVSAAAAVAVGKKRRG